MRIGPKYKIARRLGAAVFEKTQTQKFALRNEKKRQSIRPPKSNYGKQLIEKQKVRFTYGISNKQLSKYIKKVIEKNPTDPSGTLFTILEKRLDNVVLRAGLASTRFAAKQIVSHGHILVNNKKMSIPSYQIESKDKVSIKESSKEKGMFTDLEERLKDLTSPKWIILDKNREITFKGVPVYSDERHSLDLQAVIQFYKR